MDDAVPRLGGQTASAAKPSWWCWWLKQLTAGPAVPRSHQACRNNAKPQGTEAISWLRVMQLLAKALTALVP